MSTRRPGPTGEDDLLAGVLRAAAAPAHPGELAGEEAAVAAFRAAVAQVETEPARPSAFRRVVAKVLTVKAAVAVAVVGSAGVVLAASGGVLPTPWSTVPPAEQPATSTTAPAVPDPSARSGPRSTTAEPAVVDLCAAYAASDGKHRADPKFGPLIAAAGGADDVAKYCATHAPPSSKNSSKNEPGNGNPTKSPNTENSGKNKPEKPTGGKPTAPPGESVKPGKNPPGEANTPTKAPPNTPGNTSAKPSAKPESVNPPGLPSQAATPSRGRG